MEKKQHNNSVTKYKIFTVIYQYMKIIGAKLPFTISSFLLVKMAE